jgi:hypothetical protein
MNKFLIFSFIIFAFCSCKKDKIEYINYNSEILIGKDTLIYGNWEYLHTWTTGGLGGDTMEDQDLPSLVFTPIGNYEKVKDGQSVEEGKIFIQYGLSSILIGFYENGINVPIPITSKVNLSGPDTLIFTSGLGGNDMSQIEQYFVRIND